MPVGATLVPVIIASDKTQLSTFSGDKQAWPVYITIGNIEKATRRKPSTRATILLGYIPVSKLEAISKEHRSVEGYQIFHDCMKIILEPLVKAGTEGIDMGCADGFLRKIFPILSAYIADYPEQCLVACCQENACPICLVKPKERGQPIHSVLRDPETTIHILEQQAQGLAPSEFKDHNMRPINPFWKDLPHCNIFSCMTPDMLHQLHKGVFKDHVSKWAIQSATGGPAEIDARFQVMSRHPTLRHFKRGISMTTQWTGNEHKNMAKVFLGTLIGTVGDEVLKTVRGVLDFIGYAHFETHCDESLAEMDRAWVAFHEAKGIFEDLEIRKHFNISKIHNIKHYIDSIHSRGTTDGFNSEATERLHIDLAKLGYRASNKKEYTVQMVRWLTRQEAVHRFTSYLQWAMPHYAAVQQDAAKDRVDDDENKPEELQVEDEHEEEEAITYHIAKTAPFPKTIISTLAHDYKAPDFLYHLQNFMNKQSIAPQSDLALTSTIPVYKQVVLKLPFLKEASSSERKDVVHATRAVAERVTPKGIKKAIGENFSTVIIRVKKQDSTKGPLHGKDLLVPFVSFPTLTILQGLAIARVRLIFRLPDDFGAFKHPLAYVDWFKPLRDPGLITRMYNVSLSSQGGGQRASIISVSEIERTCHISPHFGHAVDPTWESDTVLNLAVSFYLNPYLRHHDFFLFRHQVALFENKRKEHQENLARKRQRRIN